MDFSETLDNNYASESQLSTEVKSYLRETAKWAKFMAIVGFVMVGMFGIGAFSMFYFAGSIDNELGMSIGIFVIIYLLMAAFIFMPIYYLYQFAINMQRALRSHDEITLADSFKNLKSHYKFNGIVLAVVLGFYALAFLIVILGGISSFM